MPPSPLSPVQDKLTRASQDNLACLLACLRGSGRSPFVDLRSLLFFFFSLLGVRRKAKKKIKRNKETSEIL